jgi:hypothetical protein
LPWKRDPRPFTPCAIRDALPRPGATRKLGALLRRPPPPGAGRVNAFSGDTADWRTLRPTKGASISRGRMNRWTITLRAEGPGNGASKPRLGLRGRVMMAPVCRPTGTPASSQVMKCGPQLCARRPSANTAAIAAAVHDANPTPRREPDGVDGSAARAPASRSSRARTRRASTGSAKLAAVERPRLTALSHDDVGHGPRRARLLHRQFVAVPGKRQPVVSSLSALRTEAACRT